MTESPERQRRSVLVVDDSEDDVLLLSRKLQHEDIPWNIAVAVSDGEQAIEWLR